MSDWEMVVYHYYLWWMSISPFDSSLSIYPMRNERRRRSMSCVWRFAETWLRMA